MLDIKSLSASIDGKKILDGFDLKIKPGEVHAIMGPNGSGKSTLANVLTGKNGYEIEGQGTDTKGKGGATMELVGVLSENENGTTEINGDSTITIQGMLAQFGSRMVEDVSNQLFIQFTNSLAAKLEDNSEISDETESSAEALSGVLVAGAALKGISSRLMDKFKKKGD